MRNHSHCSRNRLARDGGLFSPEAGPKSRGREEQRDESRLQQHAVGLIAGKILRRGHERKEADEANQQIRARPDVENDQQRSDHAAQQIAISMWLLLENHSNVGANHMRD